MCQKINFLVSFILLQLFSVYCHDAAHFEDVIEPLEHGAGEKPFLNLKNLPPPPKFNGPFPPNLAYGQGGGRYVGSETAPSVADIDGDPLRRIKPINLRSDCRTSQNTQNPGPDLFNPFGFGFNPLFPPNERSRVEDRGVECVQLTNCSSILGTVVNSAEADDYCALEERDGFIGICCHPSFSMSSSTNSVPNSDVDLRLKLRDSDNPKILPQALPALGESTKKAKTYLDNLAILQKNYVARGIHLRNGSRYIQPPLMDALRVGEGGLALAQVTRELAAKLGITGQINRASVLDTEAGNLFCSDSGPPDCPLPTKQYRQLDGSCNNPKFTKVGQTLTPLVRLTYASYSDGVFSPRVGMNPNDTFLPSARLVSATVATGDRRPSNFITYLFAQHGQFVAHDMSHVPFPNLDDTLPMRCCTEDGKYLENPEKNLHPLCFPIEIPIRDPFYKVYDAQCMTFVRSMISSTKCSVGPADQLNQVTHWMDLSGIYGPTQDIGRRLREFSGGRLKSMIYNGKQFLNLQPYCQKPFDRPDCMFQSGDVRVNHQLYLTVLHNVWNREHNRIADILSGYHSDWTDEIVFQEARRIAIAEFQHITYNEMIPLLVGPKAARKFNLVPLKFGYTDYDLSVDGSVGNEHTTAAFRMGHSMIEDFIKIISNHNSVANLTLHETGDNSPYLFYDGVYDGAIRGLTRMSAENFDQWVTKELTQHLFQDANKPYGMDLAAINVQRGRDHGLPSYAAVVNFLSEYCNLPAISSFEDMSKMIPEAIVGDYTRIYSSYADVDLWIGGLCENPIPGGIVGPTFSCILGNQFARSKIGDRFYYEHGGLPNSFTPDQLESIRNANGARLFCDNGDDISSIQPLVFHKITSFNPLCNCTDNPAIPFVDLTPWQNYQISP